MKVLLIDVNCKYSSTGKIVYSLFEYLNSHGHEARVAYGRGDLIDEEGIYKFGLDWETNIHAGLARITGKNGCYSFFSTRRLIEYIDEFKPDVIHIHELHAYFVNIKPLVEHIKGMGCKVVWTFHCEYMYTGKCGYAYECDGWKWGCGNCPAIREYPKTLFLDRTKLMFHIKQQLLTDMEFTVVTPSVWLADRTKESFLNSKDIRVVHNGIEMNVFEPASNAEILELRQKWRIERKRIVLSVAPDILNERKGGKTVLEIASLAKKNEDLVFVLIGVNPEEVEQCTTENVIAIPRTKNQKELALWYSAADLFLICSKRENFPTTCLESLACGTPIVGIDAGGTAETAPEPYGKFVKTRNSDIMLGLILEQLGSKPDKKEVARFAREAYSTDAMCKQYIEIYEEN